MALGSGEGSCGLQEGQCGVGVRMVRFSTFFCPEVASRVV